MPTICLWASFVHLPESCKAAASSAFHSSLAPRCGPRPLDSGQPVSEKVPFAPFGIDVYRTVTLLRLGYVASSLPTNARVLVGAVSQIQTPLHEGGRTHGLGGLRA